MAPEEAGPLGIGTRATARIGVEVEGRYDLDAFELASTMLSSCHHRCRNRAKREPLDFMFFHRLPG
jgi:hypothetical protein